MVRAQTIGFVSDHENLASKLSDSLVNITKRVNLLGPASGMIPLASCPI